MVRIKYHHITGEMIHNDVDYDYITRAYEMMTPEEIASSEQRMMEIASQDICKRIKIIEAAENGDVSDTLYGSSAA